MMQTVDALEGANLQASHPSTEFSREPRTRIDRVTLLLVIVTVAVGLCARIYRLDSAGFAEDETNKVFALRAYEQGDFTANAEHPMLMKLFCYGAMHSAAWWNRTIGSRMRLSVSDEAALRLPNAIFGALTAIPLLLFATALLGRRVGAITAFLWALGLDSVWFNRIAKEDTMLVFFELSGFYLYHRAKQLPPFDSARKERLFALAGAAFGLMVASKYFPHYIGLNALFYTIIGYDSRNNRPLTTAMWAKYFGGLILAFSLFNPAAFFPQTWRYLWKYVNEEFLTHHGYLVMDKLYINDFAQTPGGTPWYFYPLFLVVKLPVPVLVGFAIGLIEIFRTRGAYPKSRGYLFLRLMLVYWLIPELVVGVKFLRYSLTLLPLVYMTAAIGAVVVWDLLERLWEGRNFTIVWRPLVASVSIVFFVGAPSFLTVRCLMTSYPSLYVNSIGRSRIGYFFPHDEYYDLGARESIRFVAENAPANATLASEVPGAVQYYLERYNRLDIRSRIMSQPGFTLDGQNGEFILLQRGRVYFENIDNFDYIVRNFSMIQSSSFEGATTAAVYSNPIK